MISEEGENTMAKTKVICFTNNKGGSGKTTTCSNVGFGLRELGKKVLMIDGDMQLNLSLSLFDEDTVLAYAQSDKNLYEAIKRQDDPTDYIVNTKYEGLDLIPSSTLMSSIEYELFTKWQREYILKKGLKKIRESEVYDYILIDAPPTLGGCDSSGRGISMGTVWSWKYVRIPGQCRRNCTGSQAWWNCDHKG